MTALKKKTVIDFTEGPILKKMLIFALPIIGNQLLQTLYNSADMIVVGQWAPNGDIAMGAVGACGSLIRLFINLFFGIAAGVGICVAQKIGAKATQDVETYIHTSAVFSFFGGIALMIVGMLATEPLLLWTGVPESMLPDASAYMRAYFIGIPAMMVLNFLSAALRASGDTIHVMIFMAISGAANVLVNLVMVVGFGWGAAGVGLGTTVAQTMAAVMIVVHMMRLDGMCRLSLKKLGMSFRALADVIRNGLPVGLQSVVLSFSNIIVQTEINSYGDIVVSGMTAAANLEGYISVAMNSVAVAVLTVISQNVGARKYRRVRDILIRSALATAVIGIVVSVLMNIFADPLLLLYRAGSDERSVAIREAGAVRLLIVCLPYFLCGVMGVLASTLKGMKRSITTMVITILGHCVFQILWIRLICPHFAGQLPVLLAVFPASWLLTSLLYTVFFILEYRKQIKAQAPLCFAA
jgi:putative MATE family efflux protein